MLSKRDVQFGRGRPVAPDTFIRPQRAPTLLLRYGRSRRPHGRHRAYVADPGGAAPPWLLALAHPRRAVVKGTARASAPASGAGTTDQPSHRSSSPLLPSGMHII